MTDHLFWVSLAKIVWIDVLLSGDNAVVIALACAALPPHQRLVAMIAGTCLAVALRIALTGSASYLMELSYLKLGGGLALAFVAAKLLVPEEEGADLHPPSRLLKAIGTIVVADISMSIDNVIAVAAASYGNVLLLGIGLLISIPVVVGGASIISKFIERFPILVWAGAALLGWIAGEVIVSDPVVTQWISPPFDWPPFYGVVGLCTVLAAGSTWRSAKSRRLSIRTET